MSTSFEDALIFTIKQNSNGETSLQTNDNKYLKLDSKNFNLSSKERLLTINKQQNIENIADFEEIVEITKLHKEKAEKINEEEFLIACKTYDNKTDKSLEYTFGFTESIQKEHNFTLSTDFTLGASAKLSCSSIVGAEIGGQIEKKTITSNSITETENKTVEESFKVDCSPWKKTRVKLLTKKVKLLTPYTATIKRTIGERTYEYLIDGKYFSDNYSESHYLTEEITVKNILLVGCTGSGKSTLAKVLSGDNKFEAGDGSVSKTKFFKKSDEFKWKENGYCVIDNIGFGDTKLSEREELIRIGKAINAAYQGLSHVLFVFGGRFSDKEKEGFRKLAALRITNYYITLVRSKFDNFYNEDECKEDEELLRKESPEISQLFDNCRGILHIDNGDEDSRDESREKVLDYLHNNCENDPFKPEEWKDITSLIEDYFREKTKLENEKDQANDVQKQVIEQKIDILKNDTAAQVKEKIQGEEISGVFQLAQIVQK
ncbi:MAG: hypothetical protein MRERV_20c051 [Mycoplasmataceae bacterium RV_VA103A]|nr:MAG: hypothetical protein MRERV_20c051 [Mycoplasmataceae bacterium RV_VA103A]